LFLIKHIAIFIYLNRARKENYENFPCGNDDDTTEQNYGFKFTVKKIIIDQVDDAKNLI